MTKAVVAMKTSGLWIKIGSALVIALWLAPAAFSAEPKLPEGSTAKETEIGREGVKEVEAYYKLVDDKATLQKLNEMAKTIGAVSDRPKINYVIKIIGAAQKSKDPKEAEKEINAFTLPGGFIYVTKGLLNFVESDHELASVIAHEIAHNARLHALKQMAKEKKLQWLQIASIIGIIAGGESGGDIALFSQLIVTTVMNGYSVELEKDADLYAVAYLRQTPYNPVGLLTFMQRLERDENRRPRVDPGIFRTHPPTEERVAAAKSELKKHNIAINPRDTTDAPRPVAEPVAGEKMPAAQVKMDAVVICKLGGETQEKALQRARAFASDLDKLFDTGLREFELRVGTVDGKVVMTARFEALVEVSDADVKLNNTPPERLARQWVENVKKVIWKGVVKNGT